MQLKQEARPLFSSVVARESDLAHTGFRSFLTFMDFFRPRLLLHGHSHVYRADIPTRTRYQATQVINVYPFRLIDWDAETGHAR